ncbi:hypothetical protein [Corynebacterium lubricantis]|uniref:hypothetical protein n=1 Tax=Corynebacterium lubricantis TaxID=541095 RepID=UPI00037D2CE8|nr:hypothetical protein [Corynebacterium lubricantis]
MSSINDLFISIGGVLATLAAIPLFIGFIPKVEAYGSAAAIGEPLLNSSKFFFELGGMPVE